jgi:hypothetical protein
MDLPRPLAPWGPYLSIFPRDLALSLGPVLQRLSSAVGPLKVRRSSGDGEADGFDGLTRRGSYERLLASEWLLADEAPDEFMRRAVTGEHIFLRINHPAPGGSRVSVAIFDAGPGQLGSPRIAQLAALIVLARRAEAAGVRFAWGILQDPDGPLFSEVTEAGVLRLLQARTPHEASEGQVQAWRDRVRAWKELDDLWIVGPPRLGAMPTTRGASVLQVWDTLDPEMRRVAVKVRRGQGTTPSEVSLELPEDAACVRLLRDPFAASAAAPRRLAAGLVPVSNLIFAANASKLFARAAGGGLVGFPIPNSQRADAGAPRHYDPRPGAPPVAVGVAGKRVAVATSQEGVLVPWYYQKRGGASPGAAWTSDRNDRDDRGDLDGDGAPLFRDALPGDVPPLLHPMLTVGGHAFVLDAEGALFRLAETPSGRALVRLAERVAAAAVVAGQLAFVEPASESGPARIATVAGNAAPITAVTLDGLGEAAFFGAFFGYGGRLAHPEHGLAAIEHPGGQWELLSSRGRPFLIPFAGTRVVGVARDAQRGEPGLLLLEEDRRTLLLAGLSWTRKLPPAAAEIAQVAASSAAPHYAYTTLGGEIVMGSFDHDAPLFRLIPEGEA